MFENAHPTVEIRSYYYYYIHRNPHETGRELCVILACAKPMKEVKEQEDVHIFGR